MSLRRRLLFDLVLGMAVAVLAMGVVYWQAATADPDSSSGQAFRLVCPLH
jgi:CHASE3 domain sensor protein